MSNNEIVFYNAIYIGNSSDISNNNNLSDIPEEIYTPLPDVNQEKVIYMPVCYFLENTQHYNDCKNMLSSLDYLKYTEEYKPKIDSYISNLNIINNLVKTIIYWETPSEIRIIDSIDDSLEIFVSTTVINSLLEISTILKSNFIEEEDINIILKYSHNLEKWYNSLEQVDRKTHV